jgi:hypothetical protein
MLAEEEPGRRAAAKLLSKDEAGADSGEYRKVAAIYGVKERDATWRAYPGA